jgi:hypothetical protein
MQEDPSETMSVTEHVHEAWRLLLQLPDGERERVTEDLAGRYAWSEVEAGASAMRRGPRDDGLTHSPTEGRRTATDRPDADDELAEITANLTPSDVTKVRNLVEALRDGVVTVAELHELPDAKWMELIAARRAA